MARSMAAGPSPLDTQEAVFRLLVSGPEPLAVDGRVLGAGLPPRLIPLDELKRLLLDRATSHAARDAALRELVARARTGEPDWVVGLIGVLLPGLRHAAGRLARRYPGDPSDLDAELLVGLLEHLATLSPDSPKLQAKLIWAAYRRSYRLRCQETAETLPRLPDAAAARVAPSPQGHPDLVLGQAVASGVVTRAEADLIARTRLETEDPAALAAETGERIKTLRFRRWRAEHRLAQWLVAGEILVRDEEELSHGLPARRRTATPGARNQPRPGLDVVPMSPAAALAHLTRTRRAARRPPGLRFALGVAQAGQLVGVVLAGRPVGALDDGRTLEVVRIGPTGRAETDGYLYRAARRAAKALGYRRLVAHTMPGESDAGLRAAGWRVTNQPTSGPSRTADTAPPRGQDTWRRWEVTLKAVTERGAL